MKSLADLVAGWRFHDSDRPEVPESGGCINCGADLAASQLYAEMGVCDSCRFHYSLGAHRRIAAIVDPGSFHESNRSLISADPLSFRASDRYRRRLLGEQRRTGLSDAIVTGRATVAGRGLVIAALDFRFMGGSIGCAAGEKIARALEQGARRKLPVVLIVSSGGVRMQEGPLALMQFAKVAAAASRLAAAGEPLISVLANPSIGGSYAILGNIADFLVAEPGALVGYARAREINDAGNGKGQETSRFSETQLAHGLIDQVVERPKLRDYLSSLLELLACRPRRESVEAARTAEFKPASPSAWTTIQIARHAGRPTAMDYIGHFSDSFVELRGDRTGGDDPSVVCGLGMLGAESVIYVGLQRHVEHGADLSVGAAGLRKARQAFEVATRLRLPIVTLIDGVIAAATVEAEDAGLGAAMAGCLTALAGVSTPVVGAIIGEARGETALAFGLANRLVMLQNAAFEVLSPEAAASILYRDSGMADSVATSLKPTAADCKALGIVDEVVPEPAGGAHADHEAAARLLGASLQRTLAELRPLTPRKLSRDRYRRYRGIGRYSNYLGTNVGYDVAQFGGDMARKAGGAIKQLTRRARRSTGRAARQADNAADALAVP